MPCQLVTRFHTADFWYCGESVHYGMLGILTVENVDWSVPTFQVQWTLPPQPIYQTLLFNSTRIWAIQLFKITSIPLEIVVTKWLLLHVFAIFMIAIMVVHFTKNIYICTEAWMQAIYTKRAISDVQSATQKIIQPQWILNILFVHANA